jgi:hypothetical protein
VGYIFNVLSATLLRLFINQQSNDLGNGVDPNHYAPGAGGSHQREL